MFFSLMNSPATFQTMMNNIAELIRDGMVCVYMDNKLTDLLPKSEQTPAGHPSGPGHPSTPQALPQGREVQV